MPEEYDIQEPAGLPHMRAFGAGAADPMGIPTWVLDQLAQRGYSGPIKPELADWLKRRAQEMRNESPIAAGMGSGLGYGLGLGGLAKATGELGAREVIQGIPLWMQLGGAVGGLRDSLFGPLTPPRPQGRYPPSGAY